MWRPDLKRIRAEIAAEAELELEVKVEASDGDGAKQGTKRKRAPPTKGPCEHGVKTARSARCAALVRTVVGAVECKECGGAQYASTVVSALSARSAVGLNLRARSSALYVQGVRWVTEYASTVVSALSARSAVVHQYASTVVSALSARSAVGVQSASTVVSAIRCKECKK